MKRITCMMGFLLIVSLLRSQTNNLPDINLEVFVSGFSNPVGIEHAGGEWLYIVEQTGKIKIIDGDGHTKSPFLNLSDKISTEGFEQGLLGLAFHPEYSENGYFYVHYTNLDGNSRISRFNVNPNNPKKALPSSEVILFENEDPFRNHNSGQITFGPDGYLYFTMGDGGSGGDPFNNGQDLTTSFGKLLRMETTEDGWTIPASNPYVGMAGAEGMIWASGLRNPWRFSFDMLTGDLWIPDVGQNMWEEVNYTPAGTPGVNYAWSCMEGLHPFKVDCDNNGVPFNTPVAEYEHDDSFPCSGSITGGFVYRGSLYPDMYGKYIYTDFCTGVFRTTYWDGSAWVTAVLGNFTPLAYSTFGQDIYGELYVANKTSGTIYRVTDGGGGAFASVPAEIDASQFEYVRENRIDALAQDVDIDEMIIESIQKSPLVVHRSVPGGQLFEMSPNPNHGQFTIRFAAEQPETYHASISDLMGHQILDAKKEVIKGMNEWEFNSTELVNGIYFMHMKTEEGVSILRFVVE